MDILTKNNISLLRDDSFIHLDQGAHYTSPIFQKKFKIYNLEIYIEQAYWTYIHVMVKLKCGNDSDNRKEN